MKKLIVLGAVMSLAVLGCEDKKKKAETAPTAELTQPAPQPYVPPTGNGATGDTSGTGTVITPITPTEIPSTPAPEKPKATVQRPSASKAPAVSSGAKIGSSYTVKTGDSLSEIAAKKYGKGNVKKGVDAIKKANKLKSDVIRVGQTLKIPTL